jgi:thiamine biosynthesis lipoprotein
VSAPIAARWTALGTTASVYVTDPSELEHARARVEDELAAIDLACSRFREDSEISRLNAAAGGPMRVSPLLCEAIAVALRAARLTDGIVDPTIGEALVLAGYDRDFASIRPASGPLKATRVAGWRAVGFDRELGVVTLPRGVLLDLGATAKALAADRAARAAAAAAGCGVLVDLGGDLAACGPAPAGGWRVRVTDDHAAGPDAPGETVEVSGGGLATSSTAVRRWPGGHHIVDPATGAPAAAPWRTVSVAAATCVDANIASTAAIVLGAAAPGWLAQRRLPARLCTRDCEVLRVAGWPAERAA